MLTDCYGTNTRGTVNIDAVAAYTGVTPTTVRRWIRKPAGKRTYRAAIPEMRLAQLQRASSNTELRNEQTYQYALAAIAKIRAGSGILDSWQQQGWLNDHTVAIVEVHGKPWHQVVVTKANTRAMTELHRRATPHTSISQPTRFHAQVVAHAVMLRQQNWRVHPASTQLAIGRTQVWSADAPPVDLASLAEHVFTDTA